MKEVEGDRLDTTVTINIKLEERENRWVSVPVMPLGNRRRAPSLSIILIVPDQSIEDTIPCRNRRD